MSVSQSHSPDCQLEETPGRLEQSKSTGSGRTASDGQDTLLRQLLAFFVLWIIPFILITAACMKAWSPSFGLQVTGSITLAKLLTFIVVVVELNLAILLLLRCRLRIVTWLTLVMFTIFIAIASIQLLLEKTNCGCFGTVKVNPFWTLSFDLLAAVCVFLFRQRITKRESQDWITTSSKIWICAGASMVLGMIIFATEISTTSADHSNTKPRPHSIILVDPADWIGKRFPLELYLVEFDQERMESPEATLVLHSKECEHCQELIPRLQHDQNYTNLILIEVPPLGKEYREDNQRIDWCHLDQDYRWVVQTPLVVALEYGVVTSFQSSETQSH